jgi:hypothetical protein
VIGVLSLRTVLRNVSWMFCAGLLSMCRSPISTMSYFVMENAQALATTAKLGPEPERAQNLLLEVYTPYRVALEPNQGLEGKRHQRRHLLSGNLGLDATWLPAVYANWRC